MYIFLITFNWYTVAEETDRGESSVESEEDAYEEMGDFIVADDEPVNPRKSRLRRKNDTSGEPGSSAEQTGVQPKPRAKFMKNAAGVAPGATSGKKVVSIVTRDGNIRSASPRVAPGAPSDETTTEDTAEDTTTGDDGEMDVDQEKTTEIPSTFTRVALGAP